jgi:hypothetical protein
MEFCAGLDILRPSWKVLLEEGSQRLFNMKKDYRAQCDAFERAYPLWERHLANLACYLVFRHWLKAVNDDNLYGRAAMAAAGCLLIYHLCLLEWQEKGSLFPAAEAAIWSAFSREIEHLEENLTDFIEALFDNETWPLITALLGE